MGALTALTALMSLTVSACPQQGHAGVLAGHRGACQVSPSLGRGGWSHLAVC